MAEDTEESETEAPAEDENQYGGGEGEIDAVEQTERVDADEQSSEDEE